MIGVDSGRSGAVSQASVPVLLPASVSAFPLAGRRTGTEALNTIDACESPVAPATQPKLIFASRFVRESAFEIASSSVTLPCLYSS